MNDEKKQLIERALEVGNGILRLAPTWVPRLFAVPGRRLRLHPDDIYPLGFARGGICERWLASTQQPDNGPLTGADEGLSYIVADGGRVTLREAIELMGERLIGREAMEVHGGWVMFGKLFDNATPVPFHLHLSEAHAGRVGRRGKPEAYYFPPQYNFIFHDSPYTYFGLNPTTTREQVIDCLRRWDQGAGGDNGILNLSRAYRITPGAAWEVPAAILHGPGTLCTYEPQRASDVLCMFQSLVAEFQVVDPSGMWKDVPKEHWHDYDYLLSLIDWEVNIDPHFAEHHALTPHPVRDPEEMRGEGYREVWVTYRSPYFSAKELTVLPGRTVTIRDGAAYGLVLTQGYGRIGDLRVSSPSLVRWGEMTEDELFVSDRVAKEGVVVCNLSDAEPLVMLKHFNPDNPDIPRS